MPRRKPCEPPKPKGRPKKQGEPTRKTMSLRIDLINVDWMYANLPRAVSISDFVNEALAKHIRKKKPA